MHRARSRLQGLHVRHLPKRAVTLVDEEVRLRGVSSVGGILENVLGIRTDGDVEEDRHAPHKFICAA